MARPLGPWQKVRLDQARLLRPWADRKCRVQAVRNCSASFLDRSRSQAQQLSTVTFAFDSPTALAPGTQVGIEIDAEQRSNVPLVPAIAVLNDAGNNPVVIVAAGSLAQRRPVVTGVKDGQNVEIRSGLKAGELIMTQGHSSLRDGTPISVTTP